MASPSQVRQNHPQPLPTPRDWHQRPLSSLAARSEAFSFHVSHAHRASTNMELRRLTSTSRAPPQSPTPLPRGPSMLISLPPPASYPSPLPSPEVPAPKMDRQDSGYASSPSSASRPSSTSSAPGPGRRNPKHARGKGMSTRGSPSISTSTATTASTSSTARPPARRHPRSARPSHSGARPRPALCSRHTTPSATSTTTSSSFSSPSEFYHFPSLPPPAPPPPPPATVQYWTSDSTRRLEYAAIDAASQGVKGFFARLVPDCIQPAEKRRARFCEGGEGSEAGSVRRYRLVLPEEGEKGEAAGGGERDEGKMRGLWRRWTGLRRGSGGPGGGSD
ncbi:hypothetical protein BUE80_DR009294 [Diplocarpon rosae]|nr:hypothetical protein BUE80_DR009294 [Diplocarpon rosae]